MDFIDQDFEENQKCFSEIFRNCQEYVKNQLNNYSLPSHDFNHVERVLNNVKIILNDFSTLSEFEISLNENLIYLGALYKTLIDVKYINNDEALKLKMDELKNNWKENSINSLDIEYLYELLPYISYEREQTYSIDRVQYIENKFPEIKIIKDADRIDSLGTIGISRLFSSIGEDTITIYSKNLNYHGLFLLKQKHISLISTFHTKFGKIIAKERNEIFNIFIQLFELEIKESS
jgi:uncharacterized protein